MFWKDRTLRLLSALLVVIFFFGTLIFGQGISVESVRSFQSLKNYFTGVTKANPSISEADENYGPYLSEMPPQPTAPALALHTPKSTPSGRVMIGKNCFTSDVPVLMYHHIRDWAVPDKKTHEDVTAYELSTTPDNFRKQMEYLFDHGYKTILAKDLLQGVVPCNSIVLTFDDGYKDIYDNAFPIMKEYGFQGTLAIIWNRINMSDYMLLSDIQEMQADGFEIASHTLTHPGLPFIDPAQMVQEVRDSKPELEKLLGTKILTFVYPMGQFNNRVEETTKQSGYSLALSTKFGLADLKGNRFEYKRLRVSNTLHTDFSKVFVKSWLR